MMWDTYAVCTVCGAKTRAPSGSLFFAISWGACPKCGTKVEYYRLSPVPGKPYVIKVLRRVSTAVWWKPWTWGRGYWEEKEDE